jgi:hypothetical protein
VEKYWHKMWGNTGIKCGEILAQNMGIYWKLKDEAIDRNLWRIRLEG